MSGDVQSMTDSTNNGEAPATPKKAENDPNQPSAREGIGEQALLGNQPLIDPRTGSKDLRLLRAATRWNVPEHARKLILDEMILAVLDKNRDGTPRGLRQRERNSAARVLVQADAIDARREATDASLERAGMSVNINTARADRILVIELDNGDVVPPPPNVALAYPPASSNGNGSRIQGNGKHS